MDLSVIIVNYNVRHFLEQCLISARKAAAGRSIEIIVVDNHSLDGSVEMLKERFSDIRLIESKTNLGFSKGNNLGIREAKGKFVLLLNPDTLVEEDTFDKVISFMNQHPEAGGLGVKMIDGKGRFLPESKRGLPTPLVAFYKMFGLARLFPRSKVFGKYHLGFLDNNKTHEVDILSGAFMMLRKEVLDKIGLLDETFFMYGEDIDLSYRITQAGYKNYYYPETQIIHYKGESTKKTSINYVFIFYKAMVIFAQKHFSRNNAMIFGMLINMAIYFRAFITLVGNLFRKGFAAILDFLWFLTGLILTMILYQNLTTIQTPPELYGLFFPLFSLIWVVSVFYSGGYDRPLRLRGLIFGTFAGSIVVLLFYSLLPETQRFSRAIVLLGGISTLIFGMINRWTLSFFNKELVSFGPKAGKRFALVGSKEEISRVENLLAKTSIDGSFIARVAPDADASTSDFFVGHMNQLRELTRVFRIDEVIFCAENVSSTEIIHQMSELDNKQIDFKIAPPDSLFVIGSNSINTSGELYSVLNINSINKPHNQRMKRLVDVVFALLFIVLSPVLLLTGKNGWKKVSNTISVLFGLKTWVGYAKSGNNLFDLPSIQDYVFELNDGTDKGEPEKIARKNLLYAKDYNWWFDIRFLIGKVF